MNTAVGVRSVIEAGHDSHVSPKIHPAKVKHETRASTGYIKENNHSLSSFTYSPVCARATPARAYMRVCVRGG